MRILFDNPILVRDFNMRFKRFKFLFTLTAYLIVLQIIIIANWPHSSSFYRVSRAGMEILLIMSMFQLALGMFITSSYAASSVTSEKEGKTIENLYMSTTSDWEIIFGKLNAANFHMIAILIATLPLACCLFALGGITMGLIFKSYFLIIVSAYTYSSAGIFWSNVFKTSRNAIGMTVLSGFVICLNILIVLFLISIVNHSSFRHWNDFAEFSLCLNPFYAMASLLDVRHSGSFKSVFPGMTPWETCILSYSFLTTILLIASRRVLSYKRSNFKP